MDLDQGSPTYTYLQAVKDRTNEMVALSSPAIVKYSMHRDFHE